jgi:hypothetical protein
VRVSIEGLVMPSHRGVLVRCNKLGLTGGGLQDDDAVESLRRAVTAWCAGLERQHMLDDALRHRGIQWTDDDGPLVVEVHRKA